MITLSSIFNSAKHFLLAAALATSFTASAQDKVAPPNDTAKVTSGQDGARTSPANSPTAGVDKDIFIKGVNGPDANSAATTNTKIPNNPPYSQPYCVCCAKGGPYTVTASSLPSYDFANACKMNNAGAVWSVVHTGIIPCTCKGIKGPANDLKKYVK